MKNKMKDYVLKLVLSALFIALGIVLPFLTGQIPEIGSALLPMHLADTRMRLCVRFVVWLASRCGYPALAQHVIRYAGYDAGRRRYGV